MRKFTKILKMINIYYDTLIGLIFTTFGAASTKYKSDIFLI